MTGKPEKSRNFLGRTENFLRGTFLILHGETRFVRLFPIRSWNDVFDKDRMCIKKQRLLM